jgi:hypothetical protein
LKINRPDDHPPWSGRVKALYGNYLQRTCDRPDDSTSPSERGSQTGKIFNKILEILVAQLSVRTASVHITTVAHLNPQPINRGPWALRTAKIQFEFLQSLESYCVKLSELICSLSSHCKCAVAALQLKFILGVGPKVNDSIEYPFR